MRASLSAVAVVVAVTLGGPACKFDPPADVPGGDDVPDADPDADPDMAPPAPRLIYASRVDHTALDLLLVIDDSGSMFEEQAALAAALPVLVEQLGSTGLPSLHIGVVSPNLGTGPYNIAGCAGGGDDGALQAAALVEGCTPPSPEPFVRDLPDGAGGRTTNYTGTLAETVSCVAQLGIAGCGFEQHLAAAVRAIDPDHPTNAGFVRDDAKLAVVFLADEDDCSVSSVEMFDTNQDSVEAPLGQLSSFRCTEFGVTCSEGAIARAEATYTGCAARDDSPYLPHPREYAADLIARKGPGSVFAAAIVAPGDGFEVQTDDQGRFDVADVCGAPDSDGVPGIRFQGFLDELPGRAARYSICGADYTDEVRDLGQRLASISGGPICLGGSIPDPSTCRVFDVTGFETGAEARTELPACDGANAPCFELATRQSTCPASSHHQLLEVNRIATPAAGTVLVVECE